MNNYLLKRLNRKLFYLFGEDCGGNSDPPGSTQVMYFGEIDSDTGKPSYVATTWANDGFELWLGTPYKWDAFYNAADSRRLAWFILWNWWAKGTWFGLKRKIYYWLLHNEVNGFRGIDADAP